MENRLLTIRETASRLGVKVGTLYTWAWKKKGIKFVRAGRALRVGEEEIEDFIRRNTTRPLPDQRIRPRQFYRPANQATGKDGEGIA